MSNRRSKNGASQLGMILDILWVLEASGSEVSGLEVLELEVLELEVLELEELPSIATGSPLNEYGHCAT
jgi:hypothetical protein